MTGGGGGSVMAMIFFIYVKWFFVLFSYPAEIKKIYKVNNTYQYFKIYRCHRIGLILSQK